MLAALVLPFPQDPTWEYVDQAIEGWSVHVEKSILKERPRLWEAARQELTAQLVRIERVVPDGPLAKLRTVPLWVHRNDPLTAGAAYHPAREWLVEHHADPQMAHGVEFGNVEHLVTWPYDQPWMAMHELAHAYQFLFLPDGDRNGDVTAAYQSALASHRYESVLHYDGKTVRAYALTNPMEYFAETTEAYFGRNDFYPFVRAELRTLDPEGYALMRKVWGEPAVKVPAG